MRRDLLRLACSFSLGWFLAPRYVLGTAAGWLVGRKSRPRPVARFRRSPAALAQSRAIRARFPWPHPRFLRSGMK